MIALMNNTISVMISLTLSFEDICSGILNILRPKQNGSHFADDVFKCIFLNENVWISLKISLKFVPKGPINNIPSLVQIMAWHRTGNKPLSEPVMVRLLTHICVTWLQWVNTPSRNRCIVFKQITTSQFASNWPLRLYRFMCEIK